VDVNKRTAFVATSTFPRLNGVFVRPVPATGVRRMEELASGDLTEDAFAAWLRTLAREAAAL
jgi:death-on-curing protein